MTDLVTYKEGLLIARRYGLGMEYEAAINNGYTPTEILDEWDLLPTTEW